MHLTQDMIPEVLRELPPHNCDAYGLCVRKFERGKREVGGGERGEREHEQAFMFNYGVMTYIEKQGTPFNSWKKNFLDFVYILLG